MKKFFQSARRVIAILLVALFIFGVSGHAAQASYYYVESYTYSTGILWWKKTYNCDVYRETGSWYRIFYGNSSVSTGFDYKGNTLEPIVISQTTSFSIEKQTVATLNSSIEVEDLGIKSGIGGSLSSSCSQTWGVSNTIQRTVPASAATGYYSYNVCLNLMKFKITGTSAGTVYIYAPNSEAYRSLVYNPYNADYRGAGKY